MTHSPENYALILGHQLALLQSDHGETLPEYVRHFVTICAAAYVSIDRHGDRGLEALAKEARKILDGDGERQLKSDEENLVGAVKACLEANEAEDVISRRLAMPLSVAHAVLARADRKIVPMLPLGRVPPHASWLLPIIEKCQRSTPYANLSTDDARARKIVGRVVEAMGSGCAGNVERRPKRRK